MSEPGDVSAVKFLPLAITRIDDWDACVGGVTDRHHWVRPAPVTLSEVESLETPYRYFCWIEAHAKPSTATDARPEDYDLSPPNGRLRLLSRLPDAERLRFLTQHLDDDVESAFANGRSLGLVEVAVSHFYVKRATGRKFFIRAVFSDASGVSYDWVVPDLGFGRIVWPFVSDGVMVASFSAHLNSILARSRTFFAVGLTKPNFQFPGKFRACHPLVVGIHTEPDYAQLVM